MNFVTSNSVPYIAHVDTAVLCDEVRNCLLQINQIKSKAVLQIKKSRYFERLTKYERFKYLLKQLDGSSLLDIVRQMASLTRTSDRERRLFGCVHARGYVCLYVLVCMPVCDCVRMCVCVCARVRFCFYFIIHKDALHADNLNNKVLFLTNVFAIRHALVLRNVTIIIQLKTTNILALSKIRPT